MCAVHAKLMFHEGNTFFFSDQQCISTYYNLNNNSQAQRIEIVPTLGGGKKAEKFCSDLSHKNPSSLQKRLSSQIHVVTEYAKSLTLRALENGQLHARPFAPAFYPRGCAQGEWQVTGRFEGFQIAILGNAKEIKYFKIIELGKNQFTDDDMFYASIENGPRVPFEIQKMFLTLFDRLKSKDFLGKPPLSREPLPLPPIPLVRSQVETLLMEKVQQSYPNEVGGFYFEDKEGKGIWNPLPEGNNQKITQSSDRFLNEEVLASAQLTDYHTHPATLGKPGILFPSDTDFEFIAQTAYLLDHAGYQGDYSARVVTHAGTFIVRPNRTLLHNNPDLFYHSLQRFSVDGLRDDFQGNLTDMLQQVKKNPAFQIEFIPLKPETLQGEKPANKSPY